MDLFADGGDKEVVEQIYRITIQVCLQGLESSVSKLHVSSTQDAGLLHPEETDALKLPGSGATVYPEVREFFHFLISWSDFLMQFYRKWQSTGQLSR